MEPDWDLFLTYVRQTCNGTIESEYSQLNCQSAFTSKSMPPSIHSPNEVSDPFNTATLSSPSRSMSTISCDSIKTIEAWLDNVERPEVTVIVEELGKAGPELAQEPEAKNTRKRKHSSSLTEEYLSLSSLRKRSQHLSQLITGYGMADNIIGAGQVYLHTSIAI